jgi:hypothetical protein
MSRSVSASSARCSFVNRTIVVRSPTEATGEPAKIQNEIAVRREEYAVMATAVGYLDGVFERAAPI